MKHTLTIIALFLFFSTGSQAQTEPDSLYIYNSIEMGTCENSQSIVWQTGDDPDHISLFGDAFGSFTGNEIYKIIISDSTGSFTNGDTVDASNVVIDTVANTFDLVFHLTKPSCINCYYIKIYVPTLNYTSAQSYLPWSVFPIPGPITITWPSMAEMISSNCLQTPVTFCANVANPIYPSYFIEWDDFTFNNLATGSCFTTNSSFGYVRCVEWVTDVACYSEIFVDFEPFFYFEIPSITFINDTLKCDLINYSYQWYLNGAAVAGATQAYYVPTAVGNYTVETTLGTCINNSNAINVTSVGVNASANGKVSISPNPFHDQLTIQTNTPAAQCIIFNHQGEIVFQQQLHSTTNKIDTQILPVGLYYVSLKGNGISSNQRFVKQ